MPKELEKLRGEMQKKEVPAPVVLKLDLSTFGGCFQKSGYPQIIHFNRIFHYGNTLVASNCVGFVLKQKWIFKKHHG